MFELARLDEARRRAAEVEAHVRESARLASGARRPSSWLLSAAALLVASAAGVVIRAGMRDGAPGAAAPDPAATHTREPGTRIGAPGASPLALGTPAPGYGRSGDVRVRVAMPGQLIESPVAIPAALLRGRDRPSYQWVRAADSTAADLPRADRRGRRRPGPARGLSPRGAAGRGTPRGRRAERGRARALRAQAGRHGQRLPLGAWPFERLGGERPLGFVEVTARTADLRVSRHLRLRDFLTHDGQRQWPRYVVVSPRLLDKLELIIDEIARLRGVSDPLRIAVDVHSGSAHRCTTRGWRAPRSTAATSMATRPTWRSTPTAMGGSRASTAEWWRSPPR
jgi:hypothetical protein